MENKKLYCFWIFLQHKKLFNSFCFVILFLPAVVFGWAGTFFLHLFHHIIHHIIRYPGPVRLVSDLFHWTQWQMFLSSLFSLRNSVCVSMTCYVLQAKIAIAKLSEQVKYCSSTTKNIYLYYQKAYGHRALQDGVLPWLALTH